MRKFLFGNRELASRRGLATVVTTMIILVATVVLGSVVVSWSYSSFSTSQRTSSALFSTNVNALNEKLVIENAWFNSTSPKSLNVTMLNTGPVSLSLTDIKIKDLNTNIITDVPSSQTIKKGSTYSSKIAYNWSSNPVSITITTARGLVATTSLSP